MLTYLVLAISAAINILLMWYVSRLLKKFFFVSENLSEAYLTTKAFSVFVESMYSMDSYHGEPMIQELMMRTRDVLEELEKFREIFEYTIDTVIEDELDAATEEEA
jgi:hypothetical protein